ncbi:hypothetical protein HK104_001696 [Borealophlyctis nickersoniae]|nr:hypothetical protein HK104_001696 [Borealophlyctis nickersoniae]
MSRRKTAREHWPQVAKRQEPVPSTLPPSESTTSPVSFPTTNVTSTQTITVDPTVLPPAFPVPPGVPFSTAPPRTITTDPSASPSSSANIDSNASIEFLKSVIVICNYKSVLFGYSFRQSTKIPSHPTTVTIAFCFFMLWILIRARRRRSNDTVSDSDIVLQTTNATSDGVPIRFLSPTGVPLEWTPEGFRPATVPSDRMPFDDVPLPKYEGPERDAEPAPAYDVVVASGAGAAEEVGTGTEAGMEVGTEGEASGSHAQEQPDADIRRESGDSGGGGDGAPAGPVAGAGSVGSSSAISDRPETVNPSFASTTPLRPPGHESVQ